MKKVGICLVLLMLFGGNREGAWGSAADDKMARVKQANDAYDAKDWKKAAALYEKIAEEEPQSARAWYRLGISLHGIGEEQRALSAYEKSLKAGLPPAFGEYQIALVYASMKEKEKAILYLQKAATDGFSQLEQLDSDTELAELRGDERFTKVEEQTRRNQKPCAYAPENRQFDFWLGEWNVVTTKDGIAAGSSRIELILADCVVQENWTSGGNIGYTGKSYNIYNQALKRWEQYWVDNAGGNIFFYGGLKNGVMDYWTDTIPQPDGTKLKRHLQFIRLGPDTVRQFSQGSTDDGKTWHVEYDFTYQRTK